MHEFASRVEKRFRFSSKEIGRILIAVLAAAFVISFNKWGGETFNFGAGLGNFILSFILVLISFFLHFSAQKLMALKLGYKSEYKLWVNGIIISVFLCFLAYLFYLGPLHEIIPIFFTGVLMYDIVPKLRAGVFRGGVKHSDLGMIAVAGPLINILLIAVLAPFFIATKSPFLLFFIKINLWVAIFSMLPIPTFEKLRKFQGGTTGLYLFIASRWVYILFFASLVVFAILILLFNIFSYIIALLLGIAITLIYYNRFEGEK
ncbi:MAG: hypothetical protein KKF46_02135 [Nanoarchaeota archaeon]|nr:hypothetical protein [Nanoarchaeota archaeon]MBU1321133.1 hypothetical protein [Nanoarchaeota archaeon]MBU1597964.1 hypothetical protein [Nanoarchaeota archaeon]MBU2441809.1 hypothetical protein [Nanoarchaeota archaeon]